MMLEKFTKKWLRTEGGRRKLFKWFVFISLFMLVLGYGIMLFLLLK